jgi:hypothetical protein
MGWRNGATPPLQEHRGPGGLRDRGGQWLLLLHHLQQQQTRGPQRLHRPEAQRDLPRPGPRRSLGLPGDGPTSAPATRNFWSLPPRSPPDPQAEESGPPLQLYQLPKLSPLAVFLPSRSTVHKSGPSFTPRRRGRMGLIPNFKTPPSSGRNYRPSRNRVSFLLCPYHILGSIQLSSVRQ